VDPILGVLIDDVRRWTLADPEGNETDGATWLGRD
jgi:hypothetical protein